MPRFIIEGQWAGYTSNQDRLVHRSVHLGSETKLREWAEKTYAIVFTDGTRLLLSVRDLKPREKVAPFPEYGKLIRQCCAYGVASVAALYAKEKEEKP